MGGRPTARPSGSATTAINEVIADFARLPAQTVPVILLRHAKAVAKSHWKRADDRRPLDDAGRADAKALAELLACFGPRARLITSPAARCVETLRPFAELSGAELREEPSLYIHAQSSRTDPADSPPVHCRPPGARPSRRASPRSSALTGRTSPSCRPPPWPPSASPSASSDAARGSGTPLAASLLALGLPPNHSPTSPRSRTTTLPTSGFWVLNLTLPRTTARRPGPLFRSPYPPPTPTPAHPASAAAPPAWRPLARAERTRAPPPAPASTPPRLAPEPTVTPRTPRRPSPRARATPQTPPAATPEAAAPPAPSAPRLISADRYDLTEP